jgi:hypothetical protein
MRNLNLNKFIKRGVSCEKFQHLRASFEISISDNRTTEAIATTSLPMGRGQGPFLVCEERWKAQLTRGHERRGGGVEEACEQDWGRNLSPHDLRRSFISDLLNARVHISMVAAIARHSRVTIMQR